MGFGAGTTCRVWVQTPVIGWLPPAAPQKSDTILLSREERIMAITADQHRFDQIVSALGLAEAAQQVGMTHRDWRLVYRYVLLPLWEQQTIHGRWPKKKVARALYRCLQRHEHPLAAWLRAITLPLLLAALQRWQGASGSAKSRHWVKLSIDDSHTWHSRGAKMAGLTKLFDYVQRRYAQGFSFVVLLLQVGSGPKLPLDIAVWVPKGQPGHQSKPQLAGEMLARVQTAVEAAGLDWEGLDHVAVLADGAYLGQALLGQTPRLISKASVDQTFWTKEGVPVKVAELLEPDDGRHFRHSTQLPGSHSYVRLELRHEAWGAMAVVVLRICHEDAPEQRLVLVSNDVRLTGPQVIRLYGARQVIEHFFWEAKQVCGWQAFQFHCQGGVLAHFPLRCLTYLLVSLFRQRHCRPSRTSLEQVMARLRKAELKMPPQRSLRPKLQLLAPAEAAA